MGCAFTELRRGVRVAILSHNFNPGHPFENVTEGIVYERDDYPRDSRRWWVYLADNYEYHLARGHAGNYSYGFEESDLRRI